MNLPKNKKMRSYLDLIPISARVRRRQNRMILLCITIAVLLVTTIFSSADMTLRGESIALREKHGSWHIRLDQISEEAAEEISRRPDVTAAGWSSVLNADADQPWYIGERKAALYGTDEREYYEGQTYLVAVYMTEAAFEALLEENGITAAAPSFYVQFESAAAAAEAREELQARYQLPEDSIQENTAVMGLAGQSSSEAVKNIYGIAFVLFFLVLLDVALPDGSGLELCRKIRRTSRVPVMFLTAADEETDIIMGLDIGGDDYITKPFKLAVFLSRVNALLRRSGNFGGESADADADAEAEPELSSDGIRVRLLRQEVTRDGEPLELTASEYKLLCLFMQNPDIVLSPEQILGRLWDCDGNYIDNSTLTVYIRRLRKKIEEDPGAPRRIVTVRGMGYKWSTAGGDRQ